MTGAGRASWFALALSVVSLACSLLATHGSRQAGDQCEEALRLNRIRSEQVKLLATEGHQAVFRVGSLTVLVSVEEAP